MSDFYDDSFGMGGDPIDADPFYDETADDTIITDQVDYDAAISQVATDPADLARIATAETMHGAAPAQPDTGLPLLPVLAFSGGAALLMRARRRW
jgi:hypothetical protein